MCRTIEKNTKVYLAPSLFVVVHFSERPVVLNGLYIGGTSNWFELYLGSALGAYSSDNLNIGTIILCTVRNKG